MSRLPPIFVHERTPIEWVLDGVAVAVIIGCLGLAATRYGNLPDTIPIHFGPSGDADGWGNKRFVWLLPTLGMLIVPFIIYLSRRPDKFNYPIKLTPENAQSEYARARLLLRCVNVFIGCLFLVLTLEITQPGVGLLGPWLLPIVVGLPFALIVLAFVPLFRKNRVDRG